LPPPPPWGPFPSVEEMFGSLFFSRLFLIPFVNSCSPLFPPYFSSGFFFANIKFAWRSPCPPAPLASLVRKLVAARPRADRSGRLAPFFFPLRIPGPLIRPLALEPRGPFPILRASAITCSRLALRSPPFFFLFLGFPFRSSHPSVVVGMMLVPPEIGLLPCVTCSSFFLGAGRSRKSAPFPFSPPLFFRFAFFLDAGRPRLLA